jgi:hypothetical protein
MMAFPYFAIAVTTILVADLSLTRPAFAPELVPLAICVEAPTAAVNVSARRKSIRSDCGHDRARTLATLQARANAAAALTTICTQRISAAERQAICQAEGRAPVPVPGPGLAPTGFVGVPGGGNIDATLRVSARLCVLLRDLPNEFESSTQQDGICVFDNFRRTIFTARSRARCGVQCI